MKRVVVRVQDNSLIQLVMQVCNALQKVGQQSTAQKLMNNVMSLNHIDDVMEMIEHYAVIRSVPPSNSSGLYPFWNKFTNKPSHFKKQKPIDYSSFFEEFFGDDDDDDEIEGNSDNDDKSRKS